LNSRKELKDMANVNEMVRELRELTRMREELEAEITSLQDGLKAVMTESDTDEISGVDYKITWKMVQSSRLDSTKLKKELPEIAEQYMKVTESRRFLLV
jgi:predicted phage-related endonuclease